MAHLLSAALIVKDEAGNLPGCLNSLRWLGPLLSEICVYDTGSRDGTQAIAEAAGARVVQGHWDGDFSRARNAALAMCSSKWALVIDADERLDADPVALRRVLRASLAAHRGLVDALRVEVANAEANAATAFVWPSVRLLRLSRAHYEGRVHEQVIRRGSDAPLVHDDVAPGTLSLQHYGYQDPQLLARKLARNAALAEREVEAILAAPGASGGDRCRALVDRARSRMGSGDIDGGLADLAASRGLSDGGAYRLWGLQLEAGWLLDLERPQDAFPLIEELAAAEIDQQYTHWLIARALVLIGDHEGALAELRRIDQLVSAIGSIDTPAPILEARMRAAALSGEVDTAVADGARLIAECGAGGQYGGLLLTLWNGRDPEDLTSLLLQAGAVVHQAHLAHATATMRSAGGLGVQIAAQLNARTTTA